MQLSALISRSRNRFASASCNVTPGWTEICSNKRHCVSQNFNYIKQHIVFTSDALNKVVCELNNLPKIVTQYSTVTAGIQTCDSSTASQTLQPLFHHTTQTQEKNSHIATDYINWF